MTADFKLAILIPTYNGERVIGDTLASLQAISNGWEYIDQVVVCDDGSTDKTISVVEAAGFNRSHFTLARHERNKGEAEAYRTMLGLLPSYIRWFLILGHDDLALPCFIERNVKIMMQCTEQVAAVSSNYFIISKTPEMLAHAPAQDTIVFRGGVESEIRHTAVVGCWWHISGSLINRCVWERFNGTDSQFRYCADWDLMLRWQSAGFLVGHSLLPTTRYREHAASLGSVSRVEFRDIVDRVNVVRKHPTIFYRSIRAQWLGRSAFAVARRTTRQMLRGNVRIAMAGVRYSGNAILGLLSDLRQA